MGSYPNHTYIKKVLKFGLPFFFVLNRKNIKALDKSFFSLLASILKAHHQYISSRGPKIIYINNNKYINRDFVIGQLPPQREEVNYKLHINPSFSLFDSGSQRRFTIQKPVFPQ